MSEQHKKIKFGSIVLLGVNCLLGAGIFLTPGRAYSILGLNVFWSLMVCAILAIMIGLAFAEMAGKFTRTGGVYVYVYECWGPFMGFNVGFMRFLAACLALATQMVALPNLINTLTDGAFQPTPLIASVMSISFCAILCGINLITVRATSLAISLTSYLVLAILGLCIIVTVAHINSASFHDVSHLMRKSGGTVPALWGLNSSDFTAGFLLLFYAFVGFENIGVAAQDMENPERNIPRAIIGVLILVTVIYLLLFYGIIGVMGGQRLIASNDSVADGVAVVLGHRGNVIVSAGAIVALIGIGLAMSFAGPRNLVPMAVDHFLPESAGKNNERGVPSKSIIVMFVITAFFIVVANLLSKESFSLLVGVSSVCRLIQYLTVIAGIYVVRKRDIKGTYRMPMAEIFIPVTILICVGLAIQIPFLVLAMTLGVILISLAVYYGYAHKHYVAAQKYTHKSYQTA